VPDIVGSYLLHVEDCVQGLIFDDVKDKGGMRTSQKGFIGNRYFRGPSFPFLSFVLSADDLSGFE
jgi:hypothetical protein